MVYRQTGQNDGCIDREPSRRDVIRTTGALGAGSLVGASLFSGSASASCTTQMTITVEDGEVDYLIETVNDTYSGSLASDGDDRAIYYINSKPYYVELDGVGYGPGRPNITIEFDDGCGDHSYCYRDGYEKVSVEETEGADSKYHLYAPNIDKPGDGSLEFEDDLTEIGDCSTATGNVDGGIDHWKVKGDLEMIYVETIGVVKYYAWW